MSIHAAIADERRQVADLVDALNPDQLSTRSLCGQWTVHDVAAHLLMPLVTPAHTVALTMVKCRFDFDRASEALTARVARLPAAQIAAGLREHAERHFKPPGAGFETPLNDLVVHQYDIRMPLGLPYAPDHDVLRQCLGYLTGGTARRVVPAGRLAGLRLEATDLDWRWGDGALVRGPALSLAAAVCGRQPALAGLDGDGLPSLRRRVV